MVEYRGLVHRDLGAKPAITQIWPIAHLAITDAYNIGQAIARHVGKKEGLLRIGKDNMRPCFFVKRF